MHPILYNFRHYTPDNHSLYAQMLPVSYCMLMNSYLFHLPTKSELHGNNIHAPGSLPAGIQIEIIPCYLHYFTLLMLGHRLFRQTISITSTRFHLYKDQVLSIYSNKVYLSITT